MRREQDDDDDDVDDDLPYVKSVRYPAMIRVAAIVWILFGCLILVNGGVSLIVQFTMQAQNGPAAAGGAAIGGACGMAVVLLFGVGFILVGVQTLRGTAADTLGNGIGSIVFGLLNLGCGGAALTSGLVAGGQAAIMGLISGVISLIAGVGLVAAGIVVLVGRTSYLAWRNGQRRRR